MSGNKRETGTFYEKMAGAFLQEQGYQILEYNYRCKVGEIDIIAQHEGYLVFCEVKYRKSCKRGTPIEAVTLRKQQIISKSALYYVMEHGISGIPCRFDVIGILGYDEGENNRKEQIQLIKNAFDFID